MIANEELKRILKEVIVIYLRSYPGIFMKRLR